LILAETVEEDSRGSDEVRAQAKQILKALPKTSRGENRVSVDAGAHYFCYYIENDVVYLTACEQSFPKKLAMKFLEELQKEFDIQYGADVRIAKRPYAFIKFDTFIQKTKKLYADTRSQRNLSRVTEDLNDIHKVMTKNISEILGRGEKMSVIGKKSDDLLAGSSLFEKHSISLNAYALWKQPIFLVSIALIVLLVLYLLSKWF